MTRHPVPQNLSRLFLILFLTSAFPSFLVESVLSSLFFLLLVTKLGVHSLLGETSLCWFIEVHVVRRRWHGVGGSPPVARAITLPSGSLSPLPLRT
jgi:hypothetical protein